MAKKIVIAGGTGLVGARLIELLDKDKYDIHVLSRSSHIGSQDISYIKWDTDSSFIELDKMEGTDVIVNLAGAGIADKRWSAKRKRIILESRVSSASVLKEAIEKISNKPEVYIGASAIGYYGDRGSEILTESSSAGEGFLPDVCKAWEDASQEAGQLCTREVTLRIGIVLSSKSGALAEIMKTTKTGVYGYFGNGEAYYSWIHIDDLCRLIISAIENESYTGVFNGTAENPVTIKELVKAVRTAKQGFGPLVPVPGIALRLAMGEMASMLLSSMRVVPCQAIAQGFKFKFATPEYAIEDIINRSV